jgi:ADP-heptose:LPS heptosyltransferase
VRRERLSLPLDPATVRRALFVRLRRFGDTILMAPSLAAFKAWAPHARVGVVVQPGYSAFLDLLPFVDDVLVAGAGPRGAARALAVVRAWVPDLTVDFHGGSRAAALTRASGAALTVGESRFRWPVYDIRVPRAEWLFGLDRRAHTVENHLALVAALGVPTPRAPLSLPIDPAAQRAVAARLAEAGVPPGPRAVLFPTTTLRGKQWPIARWLALAARLAAAWRGAVVLQFAPPEADLAERAREEAPGAHVLGGLPLSELSALVAGSSLVVSQDSLGIHLAAAHGVPVVVLFGATDPARYRPWGVEHVVLRAEGLACSPCGGRSCRSPYYPWACIDGLDDEAVFETSRAWLEGSRPGALELASAS